MVVIGGRSFSEVWWPEGSAKKEEEVFLRGKWKFCFWILYHTLFFKKKTRRFSPWRKTPNYKYWCTHVHRRINNPLKKKKLTRLHILFIDILFLSWSICLFIRCLKCFRSNWIRQWCLEFFMKCCRLAMLFNWVS